MTSKPLPRFTTEPATPASDEIFAAAALEMSSVAPALARVRPLLVTNTPPLPSASVPALTVVAPVKEYWPLLVSVSVPLPILTSASRCRK